MAQKSYGRQTIKSKCHQIRSDPKKLKKIYQSSLIDDFVENSTFQMVEFSKSQDSHTKRGIDISIEYSKIIEKDLIDGVKGDMIESTVEKLRKTKSSRPRKDDGFSFFDTHCPRSSMNVHAFDSIQYGPSSSLSDDSVNDLTNQFDSLSTSGSES